MKTITMKKFNVGDRVVILENYLHIRRGSIGLVVLIMGDGSYRVTFKEKGYVTLGTHQLQKLEV